MVEKKKKNMNINEDTLVEYINKNNQKAQTIVNTDSLIDAQRQVETRDNVQKVIHTRPATPMD